MADPVAARWLAAASAMPLGLGFGPPLMGRGALTDLPRPLTPRNCASRSDGDRTGGAHHLHRRSTGCRDAQGTCPFRCQSPRTRGRCAGFAGCALGIASTAPPTALRFFTCHLMGTNHERRLARGPRLPDTGDKLPSQGPRRRHRGGPDTPRTALSTGRSRNRTREERERARIFQHTWLVSGRKCRHSDGCVSDADAAGPCWSATGSSTGVTGNGLVRRPYRLNRFRVWSTQSREKNLVINTQGR